MAKSRAQKEALFAEYVPLVEKKNFVIVELNKLQAKVVSKLRKRLRDSNASFYIIKNKVFARAAKDILNPADLIGPLGVIDAGEDMVPALKAMAETTAEAKFAMTISGAPDDAVAEYVPFTFKYAVMGANIIPAEDVVRMTKLPEKNVILGQVVGTLAAPISGVLNVMNGIPRKLLYALTAISEKKSQE